jgi:hypothetical protein
MKNKLARKMRERRDVRAFEHAIDGASPAMRQELLVMAQRHNLVR